MELEKIAGVDLALITISDNIAKAYFTPDGILQQEIGDKIEKLLKAKAKKPSEGELSSPPPDDNYEPVPTPPSNNSEDNELIVDDTLIIDPQNSCGNETQSHSTQSHSTQQQATQQQATLLSDISYYKSVGTDYEFHKDQYVSDVCGICGKKEAEKLEILNKNVKKFWLSCAIKDCLYKVHGHCIGLGCNSIKNKKILQEEILFHCPHHTFKPKEKSSW